MDLSHLPEHLNERTRVVQPSESNSHGFVLYWMRTAVRCDENPALDVARIEAARRDVPLLVYHALSQHYEYASDRHHRFMLEGARDVQKQFAELNISYSFHLATPEDDRQHLIGLANEASLVVTEDMPVDPPRRFLKALAKQVDTAIACVDTACVVPMQLVRKPYTRAFRFRSATKKLLAERLTRPWPAVNVEVKPFDAVDLGFESFDLQSADLAELLAMCEIDHAVGPVADTLGGTIAGYERWNGFKAKGLNQYARRRNNALVDGVSRMSAYLHYGMVSPMRIAREAAEIDNVGAEKYLDELLVWRELAYAFCFYREDHDQLSAIPEWAKESLESHTSDHRPKIYSWEQLARGKTNDEVWNAAQTSLLMQGELHNNVRMTWGKAILNWTRTSEDALKMMIDLNHRYALDGRDPASYGGLLWCLGQFDRPFEPPCNVIGTVRPRKTSDHAKRLDVDSYTQKVSSARYSSSPRIAVIGAGISGLIAARTLSDHGLSVTVFDKGRGPGGRMSSRRVDGVSTFDHGAQYFTARDPRFKRYVDSWLENEIVAKWPDGSLDGQKVVVFDNGQRIEKADSNERFVGMPSMSSVCKHLAAGLDVQTSTRIGKVVSAKESNELIDQDGSSLGKFERVIVSAPAGQAAELLCDYPELSIPISNVKMNPCWAAMVSFEKRWTTDWAGAFIHNSILTWVARNSTKPGRPNSTEHLVIHASNEWTEENWEEDSDDVASKMLAEFWKCSGLEPVEPIHLQAHRWKFAIPVDPPMERCFYGQESGIVACGDWAGGPRVEGAFLSGMAAAGRVLGSV